MIFAALGLGVLHDEEAGSQGQELPAPPSLSADLGDVLDNKLWGGGRLGRRGFHGLDFQNWSDWSKKLRFIGPVTLFLLHFILLLLFFLLILLGLVSVLVLFLFG